MLVYRYVLPGAQVMIVAVQNAIFTIPCSIIVVVLVLLSQSSSFFLSREYPYEMKRNVMHDSLCYLSRDSWIVFLLLF